MTSPKMPASILPLVLGCRLIFSQPEFLHAVDERLPADIQGLRRMGLVPIELLQRADDEILLQTFQADAVRRQLKAEFLRDRSFTPQKFREIIQSDVITAREHHHPLDDVLQLPDVARSEEHTS